jgi:3-phenylpropionate/cinnamic acid dioxygenase small subunit
MNEAAVARFVYHEAMLLDRKRYDEWLALFAEDGRYWVPLARDQVDPTSEQSIAYEDKLVLSVRVERLKAGRAFSHHPPITCQHVLQAPAVMSAARDDEVIAATPFVYVEARGDEQTVFSGTATHRLRRAGDALAIVEKRVDLVNAQAALPSIFLFL